MLANKFYIADFMKNYHQEIANLLDNGLDVSFFMTCFAHENTKKVYKMLHLLDFML